jgi:hypothetical protein
MEQLRKPLGTGKQRPAYASEHRRSYGDLESATICVYPLGRTFHVADRAPEMDEIRSTSDTKLGTQWFMTEPSSTRNDQHESLNIIETTQQSDKSISVMEMWIEP